MSQQREVLRFILTLRLLNIVSSWIASVWTTWVHLPQIIFSKYYTIYVGWIHRCRMWIWRKRVYGGLTVNSTVARVHALTTPSPLLFKGQLCWTRFLSEVEPWPEPAESSLCSQVPVFKEWWDLFSFHSLLPQTPLIAWLAITSAAVCPCPLTV